MDSGVVETAQAAAEQLRYFSRELSLLQFHHRELIPELAAVGIYIAPIVTCHRPNRASFGNGS